MATFSIPVPWWVAAFVAVVALAVFVWANRRQDKSVQRVSLIVFALAAVLAVLSFMLPSDVERMQRRTRDIVNAVNDKDWNKLQSLLDPDTVVGLANSAPMATGPKDITELARLTSQQFSVSAVTVSSDEGKQTGTMITVALEVFTRSDFTQDRPSNSSWEMDYQEMKTGWVLQSIRLIQVGQQSGDSIRNIIPRLPNQ